MYIDAETIKTAAAVISALGVIVGLILAVYKFVETSRRQAKQQAEMQEELTVICYGLKACLQGLAEQGCDGPVHDALDRLDKHLNRRAHGDAA